MQHRKINFNGLKASTSSSCSHSIAEMSLPPFNAARLIMALLIYRLINCLVTQSWFVPDEVFQSIEPAHEMVFGYGSLTWEWDRGLRSYLHVLFLAVPMKLLQLVELDEYNVLMVWVPRLWHCCIISVIGDFTLYRLAARILDERRARVTLVLSCGSLFAYYCAGRTLVTFKWKESVFSSKKNVNTFESTSLLIGLYFYPGRHFQLPNTCWLMVCVVSTVIRPTIALFWIPLYLYRLLYRFPLLQLPLKSLTVAQCVRVVNWTLLSDSVLVCLPTLAVCVLIDCVCYGRSILPLWQFAQFNVLEGGSAHFGVNAWWWYGIIGVPTVLGLHLVLLVLAYCTVTTNCINGRLQRAGCLAKYTDLHALMGLMLWYVLVLSCLGHKEQRFLLPLVPLCCLPAAVWLTDSQACQPAHTVLGFTNFKAGRRSIIIFGLIFNVVAAVYLLVFHQCGPFSFARGLNALEFNSKSGSRTVLVLMPCHSVPGQGMIHNPALILRPLSCEPNLNNERNYLDEADRFYLDPLNFLKTELNFTESPPKYLVLYDLLWEGDAGLRHHLQGLRYRVADKFWHAPVYMKRWWKQTGDRQGAYMLLFKRADVI